MKSIVGKDPVVEQQLNQALSESAQPLTREEIAEIVTEVVLSTEGDISSVDLKIYEELEALHKFIQTAKSEIAAIRPQDIQSQFIPTATDELDAVVGATEEATGQILDRAEKLMELAGGLEEPVSSQLMDLATGIFEASNFQDITGQRISKVVKTLKHIEEKIISLVHVLGEEVERARQIGLADPADKDDVDPDKMLLNGPQLPDRAIDQDEIDRLMADFG